MRNIRRLVPSGNLLYFFDVAARLESFTKAASELNVTPAAVSHAMRQLEGGIGASLFHRKHRQLELTPDGEKLYRTVSTSLDQIERAAEEIHSLAVSEIKVFASITLGTYWLLPRIASYPDPRTRIEMQLFNSDKSLDLPADGVSMAITSGRVDWPGYEVYPLAEEEIFPVCSRSFLNRCGELTEVKGLLDHNLLHLDASYNDGITWLDFLQQFELTPPAADRSSMYSNYILIVHAVLAGAGFALGWQHSIGALVERGDIVRPLPISFASGNNFQLVYRKGRPLTQRAEAVRDWLLGLGRPATGGPAIRRQAAPQRR